MASGGKREGAGRKPGVPNTRKGVVEKRVASTGITPLDYLLERMRDITAEHAERIEAAKAAAPYVHSKMPVALVRPPETPADTTPEDEEIINLYLNGIHEEADQG